MYLIGIVGRVNKNIDNQNIIQTTDAIRKMLVQYDNVVCITLLPTECNDVFSVSPGNDLVDSRIDYVLDKCDAFVVPGGTEFYNFDEYIINYAIKNDKPLLAICLGFQAMCSMFAKDRNKHEMVKRLDSDKHCGQPNSYQHSNDIVLNTMLFNILKKDKIMVNSVHHFIVDFPIDTLIVNSYADDGIIEGVEYPNKRFVMGLQWHPEYLMDDNNKLIIDEFISKIKT